MRYIFLLIVIGVSVGVFVMFVWPRYQNIQTTRAAIANSDNSLSTAAKLKASREALIAKYNSIPKADLDNLKTLLPDTVNNIRLIIQINALATKNGLSVLRNVEYQAVQEKAAAGAANTEASRRPYGEFAVSFETVGQYKNFLAFLSDLEANLRLIDVTGIDFSLGAGAGGDQGGIVSNSYKVSLKTYWLKQ